MQALCTLSRISEYNMSGDLWLDDAHSNHHSFPRTVRREFREIYFRRLMVSSNGCLLVVTYD